MNFSEAISKVKGVPGYVKSHWNTPGEGEYLTLKEMAAYTLSQSGTYIFIQASNLMSFTAAFFCGAIMEIPAMDFYFINLVTQIIGYLLLFTNPVGMLIYENHGRLKKGMKIFAHATYAGQIIVGALCYFVPVNAFEGILIGLPQIAANILVINGITGYITWIIRRLFSAKYGRVKPFIIICAIPSAILISIIPYLPLRGPDVPYVTKLVVLHFAFTLMNYFYNNFINVNGLIQYMTPNTHERQKLYSIVPIITGLPSSIIQMVLPMLIIGTGGYTGIQTYRVFVPIFAISGALLSLTALFCKERTIEENIETRKKVTFLKGAKNALKNKYLWIINVSNVVGQWQWMINSLLQWWFVYSLREQAIYGIAVNLVVIGMTPGNLACVWLVKKFEKKNILIASRFVSVIFVLGMLVAINTGNIWIYFICLFLRNTIQPVDSGVTQGLGADVQIYHQWKYGERCDSVSGVFTWLTNPLNLALGYVAPWLLERVGYTSDWDVFFDTEICSKVFSIHVWLNVVSLVLCTVPFFFYDLTKEKHDLCVKELQERLEAAHSGSTEQEAV